MGDWQPISTAPKDGTRILLYGRSGIGLGNWGRNIAGNECWLRDIGWFQVGQLPTHWFPLPDPPSDVTVALSRVMKPEFVETWLASPNEALGGVSPRDALERGQSTA